MTDTSTLRTLIEQQFEATLCMFNACLDRCPESHWHEPVVNLKFCQVCFHTLFFVDYYLGLGGDGFHEQDFHQEHADVFRDYEEAQPRPRRFTYELPFIRKYLQFCRDKLQRVLREESDEVLTAPCEFPHCTFPSRAELHVYNLRHVAGHVAQLSMRLRIDHDADVPWVSIGWKDDLSE